MSRTSLDEEVVDLDVFEQILEMDGADDMDFSESIVFGFFEQVENAFGDIEESLRERDLPRLAQLGHFLKGSAATIGAYRIRDSCGAIERYGKEENLDGTPEKDTDLCLRRIQERFEQVKGEYEEYKKLLCAFYGQDYQDNKEQKEDSK